MVADRRKFEENFSAAAGDVDAVAAAAVAVAAWRQ